MKYAVRLTRLALGSMLGVLQQDTFTVRSVGELMWGYNDSLFRLAKDVMPPENVVPHDLFGLFVGVSNSHCFPIATATFNRFAIVNNRKMERDPKDASRLTRAATRSRITATSTTGTA